MGLLQLVRFIITVLCGLIWLGLVPDASGFRLIGTQPQALDPPNPEEPPPPSESPMGFYYDAAVTSNCHPCALVGRDVLLEGGSAVDAALAALLCEGVACMHSMGLGGGFFMTIYDKPSGQVHTINAREIAAAAATENMFQGDPELSSKGALSIATPGEMKGYWAAYQRFGRLPWSRILEPTIQLCENGLVVTPYMANILQDKEQDILESPTLSEILINQTTGRVYAEGDTVYRLGLAQTLRVIAVEGGDALYTGSLAAGLAQDIQDEGGIITTEDLANYQVLWEPPIVVDLEDGMKAYTVTSPSSGPLVALILNILDGFLPNDDLILAHHRVLEAYKWAFGQRSWMGDPYFVDTMEELLANVTSKDFALQIRDKISDDQTFLDPLYYGAQFVPQEDHGTAHLSVLAPDGSAVATTSTINLYFGSKVRSRSTDIILNDIMDDFSSPNITNSFGVPPSPQNFIVPGKRPLSSMCPTIVVDANGDVVLVVGAAGGTKITTAVPWVIIRNLWFNETIKEAIDSPRLHNQLFPMNSNYEMGTIQSIVTGLDALGHNTSRIEVGDSTVTGVARLGEFITANSDYRRSDSMIAGY